MGTLYQVRPQQRNMTEEIKTVMKEMLHTARNNDKVTSTGLKNLLETRQPELDVSVHY